VQRFLDAAGSAVPKLKSRAAAAPILIRTLAKQTKEHLVRLAAAEDNSSGESDFSLLARAIMRTPETKVRDRDDSHDKSKS
jgi:hypothetical protein